MLLPTPYVPIPLSPDADVGIFYASCHFSFAAKYQSEKKTRPPTETLAELYIAAESTWSASIEIKRFYEGQEKLGRSSGMSGQA